MFINIKKLALFLIKNTNLFFKKGNSNVMFLLQLYTYDKSKHYSDTIEIIYSLLLLKYRT